jgi:hypothetical protein
MPTVAQANMCKKAYRDLISMCSALELLNQVDCTHYIKSTFHKHCMWYRPDIDGACDNWWAQNKKEMPAELVKAVRG